MKQLLQFLQGSELYVLPVHGCPGLCRGHGAIQIGALRNLGELFAEGIIIGPEKRAGGAATFLTAAGEESKHSAVLHVVQEGGVVLGCALPLPEGRESFQVSSGGFPLPILHQLLQMRGVEVHHGLPLERMGDAMEALALEEAIQPAEVKQNHGGRLRIHPSRLPATILALSLFAFVFVVIRVWLGRRRPCRRRGKRRAGGRLQLQLLH